MRNKGQQQAEVHRQAAELEWKIPPVVVPVVFYVIEKKLFVDLGKCQKTPQAKSRCRRNASERVRNFQAAKAASGMPIKHKC